MDHLPSNSHLNVHSVNLIHELGLTCCDSHSGQERWCSVLNCWIIAAFAWFLTRFFLHYFAWLLLCWFWHTAMASSSNGNIQLKSRVVFTQGKILLRCTLHFPMLLHYPPSAARSFSKTSPINVFTVSQGRSNSCCLSQRVTYMQYKEFMSFHST